MNRNLKLAALAVVFIVGAILIGNKSDRAEQVEQAIEQGYTNPSRNIK